MSRKSQHKSDYYIQTYEKPKLIDYFSQLDETLPWLEFAKVMQLPQKERKEKLQIMYDNGILPAIRKAVLSQIQSSKCHAGKDLEDKVKMALEKLDIPYGSQVPIKDNKILSKRLKGCHVIDFIVPKPKSNDTLEDYIILSTKTTLRERHLQDAGLKCKKVVFITYDTSSKVEGTIVLNRLENDMDGEISELVERLTILK